MKIIFIFLFCINAIFAQNLDDITFGSNSSIDIITWNLEFFPKNGNTTVDSTAKAIESLDADVFALQEIDDVNALVQLDEQLEDYTSFIIAANYSYLKLAFMVKNNLNVLDYYSILTGSSYYFAGRPPLVIELEIGSEIYYFVNVHLKCCGDGVLNTNDTSDEEYRRKKAIELIDEYIEINWSNKNVIVLGDFNDLIQDNEQNNIFQSIIDQPLFYRFADYDISFNQSQNWSYPSWPSDLDHILVTNELFDELQQGSTIVKTILIDNYFTNGFADYDDYISDHRPVGLKFLLQTSEIKDELKGKHKVGVIDLHGRKTNERLNNINIIQYEDGSSSLNIYFE